MTNLTRIGAVYRRTDNGHVWVVEGLWWRKSNLSMIEMLDVTATPPTRNEILPTELRSWLDTGAIEVLTIATGRKLAVSQLLEK